MQSACKPSILARNVVQIVQRLDPGAEPRPDVLRIVLAVMICNPLR